eukprot:SAG31_NODE_14023_length_831_cov_1.124317_2_plen_196_part_00
MASEGKISLELSPQEPTSCVGCLSKEGDFNQSCTYNGCGGGSPAAAWNFFAEEGLVSADCWPYSSGNLSVIMKNNKTIGPKLQCNESIMTDKKCVDGGKWASHYAKPGSIIALKNNTHIQQELMANGPVTAAFKVFEVSEFNCPEVISHSAAYAVAETEFCSFVILRISSITSQVSTMAARPPQIKVARLLDTMP